MITSKSNAKVRNLIALKKKASERNARDVFLVEGIKMFREIPAAQLREVYASESFLKSEAGRKAVEAVLAAQDRLKETVVETVSDEIFRNLSDTQSPQGVMAVVSQQHYRLEDLFGQHTEPLLLILENLQDPGNLGTIIRTAEGAGVTGILMSRGTADLYNPKVARSTMGSIFRVPFLYTDDLPGMIGKVKQAGVTVCAAHLQGRHTYDGEDYTRGTAFLIGNESRGLSDGISALADVRVRIPMSGKVESLNAAVAAAILMYEAGRQRRAGRRDG
ncbi:MAG: RNA methyltransferase [Porcincola intestinalis]|uniref:TrmH family RNA methyltransferase n=1 Tax=Porcincola intestinalis TaxID=2606632 RepID=UPI002A90C1B2|nr:RNA methyltransferase [Porcincola intestinalis]MDY5332653.1 RNA methyltransferase [Porcincola intestinalis]